jgi:hypothetical protein
VKACLDNGFTFTFGNKRCAPLFPEDGWYRHEEYEYNDCVYQPANWECACRFVVMRIRKDQMGDRQLKLLDSENYVYRVFVTSDRRWPHLVIEDYDQRADVENLIGEAQQEGLLAIPSRSFQTHHAFFQIVMLAYNLWRWMKRVAGYQQKQTSDEPRRTSEEGGGGIVDQTIRMARLKMLYVAAKVTFHANRNRVYYSIHESRATGITDFLDYLDLRRSEKTPWRQVLAPAPGGAVA